jgi:hypothetical protein
MNKTTVTFTILLALTALASGQLWLRGQALITNKGTTLDVTLVILSIIVFALGLLGLGRILYLTTPPKEYQEKNDE